MDHSKTGRINRRAFLTKAAAGTIFLLGAPYLRPDSRAAGSDTTPLRVAIEFNNHAAAAIIAMDRNMYEELGLHVTAYDSYATGAALSGAMTRGAINAAYICLVPAINAYANGGVPLRVVCGTHLYGYGLVADPEKITSVKDLEKPGIRIGCLAEGSVVATLMEKTIEKYGLNRKRVLSQTNIMSPPRVILAVRTGQLDAAFLPEHWASMTGRHGFSMLLTAKDVWPGMIGSVLVVREELIRREPETVRKLVFATKNATRRIRTHPRESAQHIARYLSFENPKTNLKDTLDYKDELRISNDVAQRSMGNLEYDTSVNKAAVQELIDYAAGLGNIRKVFGADDILDLQFLSES